MDGTITLAHAGTGVAAYGTDWLYALIPLLLLAAVTVYLVATGGRSSSGRPGIGLWSRAANSLERITGLPAWSAGGVGVGAAALLIAVVGFMWDVAWHIDLGRDRFLLTPPHTMIVTGLFLLAAGAVVSIVFATLMRENVGLGIGRFRIPYGAASLGVLGLGAICGFPLDELWHQAYGVDVTMWGPTHLLMITGASLSPLALWLLFTEAGPNAGRPFFARGVPVRLAGALLIGLSTLQGEFDFGVPQFQQLYHPVLIAFAASLGLVIAREALGPGGALKAVVGFIVIRAALALLVGEVFNRVVPHFPLYLGAALLVEAAYRFGRGWTPLRRALIAGGLVGTAGVAIEWGWTHIWGWHPWTSALWPGIGAGVAIGLAGAVVGAAVGRVLGHHGAAISAPVIAVAGLVIVVTLALPFPRNEASLSAELSTAPISQDRVQVDVSVDDPGAVRNPDWFEVLSWQGGSSKLTPLLRTGEGAYRSEGSVPVGGNWKSLVRFARKDVMVAAPVYMPADPAIGAPEVPVASNRTVEFRRDTELLLREAHGGAAWPAVVAYIAIAAVAAGWIAILAFALSRVARSSTDVPSHAVGPRGRRSSTQTTRRGVTASASQGAR